MQTTNRSIRLLASLALLGGSLAACAGDAPNEGEGTGDGTGDPPVGTTEFASADGVNGQDSRDNGDGSLDGGEAAPDDDAGGEERTVEEGDIYRVLAGNLVLNLNAYRGLQIIDFTDVENPRIIGRLAVAGSPVELYVVNQTAYVLLNNWRGYYGNRDDVRVSSQEGGLLMAVDLSDPSAPVETGRSFVPGYIQTSRVVRDGDNAALYAVAQWWGGWEEEDGTTSYENRTVLKSFDISDGGITDRSDLDLGGYVTAAQATTEALLVARYDWNEGDNRTRVSVIDISSPDGVMVEGDEVTAEGYVGNKYNMDLYEGVLRVVSGSNWGETNTNHIETFDATDLTDITRLDHETFGDGQSLFATLFLGNKAFFVTYLRVDPFHAFEITAEGEAIEHNEYIVSGWNDWFRPVFDETRLVGIGINDEGGGRTLSVSLYDITDLSNDEPMLARADVDFDSSWSEASWDDRAFSVVEDAVAIEAGDGTLETGLVLLPFTGYDYDSSRYEAGVQIYTFSDTTLTRRGSMLQDTPVRRSFLADDELTANLSDAELSFFDTSNPDEPSELGSVDLAPNYTDVVRFGDFAVRLKDTRDYYYWWGTGEVFPSTLEIIPYAENLDITEALATIDVPAGSALYKIGDDRLAAVKTEHVGGEYPDYVYETTISVYDLSEPTEPELAATFVTDEIDPYYSGYYGRYWGGMEDSDCFDCGGWWYGGYRSEGTFATDDALVFLQTKPRQELLGREEVCHTYPRQYSSCSEVPDEEGGERDESVCTYTYGGITCRTPEGGEEYCQGEFQRCEYDDDGNWVCADIDADSVETTTNCYDNDLYRYWNQFRVAVVDLSDAADPEISWSRNLADDDEGVSAIAVDNTVWISVKRPYDVPGDSRPYVRFFARPLDVTDPSAPVFGADVNVPGEVLGVDGDQIFTRDTVWGDSIIEAAVVRLQLYAGRAYLQARYVFADQQVERVALDGAGNVIVSHRLAWQLATSSESDTSLKMTVLDGETLDPASTINVDSWATLTDARAGRALFQVPGGMLVVNVEDAEAPYAQAYFPTIGWPSKITVEDDAFMFAAGRYGIYRFGLNIYNLLPAAE